MKRKPNLRIIEGRNEVLRQARCLMITAFYEGLLSGAKDVATRQKAFKAAMEMVDQYIALYNAPERQYHTAQHPLVQLLPFSLDEKTALLQKVSVDINHFQEADAIIKGLNLRKSTLNGPKWTQTSLPLGSKAMDDFWQYLRNQMRHDCLYYLPKYRDKFGKRSLQTELLGVIKESQPPLNLEQLVEREITISSGKEKLSLAMQSKAISDVDGLSIGKLAGVLAFPDGKGGYQRDKSFEGFKAGVNEWTSAVYAVDMENKKRLASGFAPLDAKEILQICATLAATIPFQPKPYFNDMAQNLALFLQKDEQMALRKALGLPVNGHKMKLETHHLVNLVMLKAAKFSGQDIRNFRSSGEGLYSGDKAMARELHGVAESKQNLITQCFVSWRALADHSSKDELKQIDPNAQQAGFIRQMAIDNKVWHAYKPLFPSSDLSDKKLQVRESKVKRLNQKYLKRLEPVLSWHRYDLAKAVVEIANKVNEIDELNEISHLYIKENDKPFAEGVSQINCFSESVFKSEFWNDYGALLRHGGIKDMRNFEVAVKVLDAISLSAQKNDFASEKGGLKRTVIALLDRNHVDKTTVEAIQASIPVEKKQQFEDVFSKLIERKRAHLAFQAR